MGTQLPPRKGAQHPPYVGPCLLWPNGRPSQQLLSYCLNFDPRIGPDLLWKSVFLADRGNCLAYLTGCMSVCLCVCDVGVLWLNGTRRLGCCYEGYHRPHSYFVAYQMGSHPPTERETSFLNLLPKVRCFVFDSFRLSLGHGRPSQQMFSSCYFSLIC